MEPPLWTESGASRFAWEREALEYVRGFLPNHEPFRAWSNAEFIADDGSVNEVDLLVVVPNGFFLVEIKSFPAGVLTGDTQLWRWRRPDGSTGTYDHPLIATDRKAKRLKSLLAKQPALRRERLPFVNALVFLSSPDLSVQLEGLAKARVVGRDNAKLPQIKDTLADPSTAGIRGTAINRPLSKAIAEAVSQAGIRRSTGQSRLGDWTLTDLLDEGPGWQDFAANRTNPSIDRRVRIYLAGRATTTAGEAALKATAHNEFRLLERLKHPNISQVRDLQQHEHGPALLLDRDVNEQRLDLWAAEGLASVDLLDRLTLIRQLGEALTYAHRSGVTHRMLIPRNVLVRKASTATLPQLIIGHWNLGTAEESTRLTMHGSDESVGMEMAERLDEQERVYVAPEVAVADRPNGVAVDVFSLGAIAALILVGRPPAPDLESRESMLAANDGFVLADTVPAAMSDVVTWATNPNPSDRLQSVEEFLFELDAALEKETAPTEVDPFDANQGDLLEGGWEFMRRLGSGATAVAVLCGKGRRAHGSTGIREASKYALVEVLKIARNDDHAQRLRDEADVLQQLAALDPPPVGIVEFRGIDRVGGHTTLHLSPAGDVERPDEMTLGSRLRRSGRLSLDTLTRWGDDLLQTLATLERAGVAHRDIKPDNLGVLATGKSKALHLVLFDFSLAKTPPTDLNAGTPGYIDPFLPERKLKRWDTSADRYSAAATLFEMATGSRPMWGDGSADPRHLTDDLPNVETVSFDPAVADGLSRFFTKALHRNTESRYGTAEDMRVAWHIALSGTSVPTTLPVSSTSFKTERFDPERSVHELGLSPAAIGQLEDADVHTVEQLTQVNSTSIGRVRTITRKVRLEILTAAATQRRLREASPTQPNGQTDDPDSTSEVRSIDAFVKALVPGEVGPLKAERVLVQRLLGLAPSVPSSSAPSTQSAWFGPLDAARLGLDSPAEVRALLGLQKARWTKKLPMKRLRDDLAALLQRSEGIASGDELARRLIARRGTIMVGEQRIVHARAVVRAALETAAPEDRFVWRRLPSGSVVVALDTDESQSDTGEETDRAQELSDYAAQLGTCADEIATYDPLASPQRAIAMLRAIARPAHMLELTDARLARLAADSSHSAALSSRSELYPRGLSAERSVSLARAALLGSGTLSEDQVRERVAARFPEAAPLPELAGMLPLLRDIGIVYIHSNPPGFRVIAFANGATSTALTPQSTRLWTRPATEEVAERTSEVTAKLARTQAEGGYLVCSVKPAFFELAERTLERMGAEFVDFDATFLAHLEAVAQERKVRWDAILAADAAGPEQAMWGRLVAVVEDARRHVEADLLAKGPTVVLSRCGLLARFNQLGMLDRLREATTRQHAQGQTLRTLWVVVPTNDLSAPVTIHERAVPATPGMTERLTLDEAWFRTPDKVDA